MCAWIMAPNANQSKTLRFPPPSGAGLIDEISELILPGDPLALRQRFLLRDGNRRRSGTRVLKKIGVGLAGAGKKRRGRSLNAASPMTRRSKRLHSRKGPRYGPSSKRRGVRVRRAPQSDRAFGSLCYDMAFTSKPPAGKIAAISVSAPRILAPKPEDVSLS